jgi:hypothetical protein
MEKNIVSNVQIVYCLSSSLEDFYYEQFFQSVTSLRIFNPHAHVVLLVDEETSKGLSGPRAQFRNQVSEVKVVEMPRDLSQWQRSRYLKTTIRKHIIGDFLYLDTDTVIAGDLSCVAKIPGDLATRVTSDFVSKTSPWYLRVRSLGFSTEAPIHNSGVLFCRDTKWSHVFFEKWHELYRYTCSCGEIRDQTSFNEALFLTGGCTNLPKKFNVMVRLGGYVDTISSGLVFHYHGSASSAKAKCAFLLAQMERLESVKETGILPPEHISLLKNPRSAWCDDAIILSGDELALTSIERLGLWKACLKISHRIVRSHLRRIKFGRWRTIFYRRQRKHSL